MDICSRIAGLGIRAEGLGCSVSGGVAGLDFRVLRFWSWTSRCHISLGQGVGIKVVG